MVSAKIVTERADVDPRGAASAGRSLGFHHLQDQEPALEGVQDQEQVERGRNSPTNVEESSPGAVTVTGVASARPRYKRAPCGPCGSRTPSADSRPCGPWRVSLGLRGRVAHDPLTANPGLLHRAIARLRSDALAIVSPKVVANLTLGAGSDGRPGPQCLRGRTRVLVPSDGAASIAAINQGTLTLRCRVCGHPRERHGDPPQCPPTCASCGGYLDSIDPECGSCMTALEFIMGSDVEQFPLGCDLPADCPVHACWRAGRCQRPK